VIADCLGQRALGISAGDTATLDIVATKEQPEPSVPRDLAAALASAPQMIRDVWSEITPMVRWEWVRWVNATKNADTRGRNDHLEGTRVTPVPVRQLV
jgi:uncharacterized protein YdeI (YjbR/CyaY-like superfamily)